MNDIFTVFRFTFKDNIRKKVFIVSTVIVVLVIAAGFAVLGLFSDNKESADTDTNEETIGSFEPSSTCYILDDANLIPGFKELLSDSFTDVKFITKKESELPQIKAEIEKNKTVSAIEVTAGDKVPSLNVYEMNYKSGVPAYGISEVARMAYVSSVLDRAGVSEEVTQYALAEIPCNTVTTGKTDLSGYILGVLLTMVIFFAVYFYGYGVAMSVASEKTSRVMETLVVSAKPSRILIGKCLGMGALGLLQLFLFLVVGTASYASFIPPGFTIGGAKLSLSSFTVSSALLILVYFLLGYVLYAMINSVSGATVSRAEDLHAAMMPVALISLVSFYAAYMTIFISGEKAKRIITYIPFTSPFIMPYRLLNETVATKDILASVAILIASIVLVAIVSVRLYAASVLYYGQRLKIRDLFKLKT